MHNEWHQSEYREGITRTGVRSILCILATLIALAGVWWVAFGIALLSIMFFSAPEMIIVGCILDILYSANLAEGQGSGMPFTLIALVAFFIALYIGGRLR